jgi:hypothetical protein
MSKAHEDETIRLALNGLDDDIRHLSHLFDLMVEEIIEVDRRKMDNAAISRVDRATAAAWIGRDFVAKMKADVEKVI